MLHTSVDYPDLASVAFGMGNVSCWVQTFNESGFTVQSGDYRLFFFVVLQRESLPRTTL